MSKKIRRCIVCGKKLGLFERLLGNTCSIKCQDTLKTSNGIEYSDKEYTDYPDIVLDVPNIELHSLPVITPNSIKNGGYSVSAPMMYSSNMEESNSIDDSTDDFIDDYSNYMPPYFSADDYNNSYDGGYSGYETHWDNDPTNDNDF